MGYTEIISIISTTGFPIAAWLLFYFDFRKIIKDMTKSNNELSKMCNILIKISLKGDIEDDY